MSHDRYRSPLGTRYASPAMQSLWGEKHRIGLWRRLWLALAEGERELGVGVPAEAIAAMKAHLDDADLEKAAGYERRFRHDVMAALTVAMCLQPQTVDFARSREPKQSNRVRWQLG